MIIHSKHTGRDVTDSVPFVVSRLGVRPESEDTSSTEGLRGHLCSCSWIEPIYRIFQKNVALEFE